MVFCDIPCTVWVLQVVQDFVQQTADEETPKEWLHHIMETSSREEGDYDINLLGTGRCVSYFESGYFTHVVQGYLTLWIVILCFYLQQENICFKICPRYVTRITVCDYFLSICIYLLLRLQKKT